MNFAEYLQYKIREISEAGNVHSARHVSTLPKSMRIRNRQFVQAEADDMPGGGDDDEDEPAGAEPAGAGSDKRAATLLRRTTSSKTSSTFRKAETRSERRPERSSGVDEKGVVLSPTGFAPELSKEYLNDARKMHGERMTRMMMNEEDYSLMRAENSRETLDVAMHYDPSGPTAQAYRDLYAKTDELIREWAEKPYGEKQKTIEQLKERHKARLAEFFGSSTTFRKAETARKPEPREPVPKPADITMLSSSVPTNLAPSASSPSASSPAAPAAPADPSASAPSASAPSASSPGGSKGDDSLGDEKSNEQGSDSDSDSGSDFDAEPPMTLKQIRFDKRSAEKMPTEFFKTLARTGLVPGKEGDTKVQGKPQKWIVETDGRVQAYGTKSAMEKANPQIKTLLTKYNVEPEVVYQTPKETFMFGFNKDIIDETINLLSIRKSSQFTPTKKK